ncbi:hypothetical protein, partial [Streptomyces sp. BR123]|uniref:hypothetical protein n=1 Tax=Streptomyces sp. BR123 TaxID=2749828 RepID=UPI001C4F01F9
MEPTVNRCAPHGRPEEGGHHRQQGQQRQGVVHLHEADLSGPPGSRLQTGGEQQALHRDPVPAGQSPPGVLTRPDHPRT